MRYRLFLLLTCLYAPLTVAATRADSTANVSVAVQGMNMVSIRYLDDVNPVATASVVDGMNATKVWTGKLKIPVVQVININNVPVLLHPGDQVNAKLSPRPFNEGLVHCENAVITGTQPARLQLLYKLDSLYRFRDSVVLHTDFEAFKAVLNKKNEQAQQLITNARLTAKEDLPIAQLYLKMLKMKVKSYYASRYKAENVYAAKAPVQFKAWVQEEAEVDHPYLSRIAEESVVFGYVRDAVPGDGEERAAYLLSHLSGDRLKHLVVWNDVIGTVRYHGANDHFMDIYDMVKKEVHHPAIKALYDSIYQAYQPLNLNQPAFDFTLYDLQGKPVRLSQFKGKMVVLDFWATWCATCIAELPNFERFADSLHADTGIVFLSIAWDEDMVWKKYLDKHPQSEAITLRLSPDESDKNMQEFVKHYQLTGVPRYMMIDAEGKFLTAFAPLPSDPAYKALLEMWMKMRK